MMNIHKILLISVSLFFTLATDSFAQKAKHPNTFYYRLGVEEFQKNQNDRSLDYFQRDLKENPENFYSQAYIGMIECKNEKYVNALNIFDSVIGKISTDDTDFRNLIYHYKGRAQTGLENYDDAYLTFSKILHINSKEPLGYEGRGYLYLKTNDLESAEKDFTKAIKYDMKNAQSLIGLGHVELAKGDIQKAIEKYGNAIEQFGKTYPEFYAYRAEAYIRLKQYENAAADIASSLEIENCKPAINLLNGIMADSAYSIMDAELESRNGSRACYYQGVLRENTKHYEKAIETYGKLLCKHHDNSSYLRLSACYTKMNNYVAAQYYAETGWRNDSNNFNLTLQKAKVEFQLGHLKEAASDAERLIKIKPNDGKSYYHAGYYEAKNRQYGKALGNLTKAISLKPDMADAYFERGIICMKYKQDEAAKADFETFIELEKEKSFSILSAFAYLNLGETEKAEQTLNGLLCKSPNDKTVLYDAACLYARLGDEDKAIAFLENAFTNGLLEMNELKTDSDLDPIRENETYKELIAHYDSLFVETNHLPELIYSQVKDSRAIPEVDEMPQFPGGESELLRYVAENVKYPNEARKKNISGRVFVQFVIEPDGSVSNIQILRGIGSICDQEAYRVVQSMPKWKPGKKDGKKVRVEYVLPINFKLRK